MTNRMTAAGYLDLAQKYADSATGCRKVAVGSLIVKNGHIIGFGANRAMPDLCCSPRGCMRVEKYGDDSKAHRNPEDCRAIHSEIDAICSAACEGIPLSGATIVVTRYPCESCAKAIITAGITKVIYGGTARISKQTEELFESNGVNWFHLSGWKEDNTDR